MTSHFNVLFYIKYSEAGDFGFEILKLGGVILGIKFTCKVTVLKPVPGRPEEI